MKNLNFRAMINHKMVYFNFEDIYNGAFKTSYSLPPLYSVMQSTGLKDTNNKEIFGGDLIKTPFDELDDIMIIGNIHENPELLI